MTNKEEFSRRYIDCVNRPLDFHESPQIPDGLGVNTTIMTDFLDLVTVATPTNNSAGIYNISGIGVYLHLGQNLVRDNTIDRQTSSTRAAAVYGISYFMISASNEILNWTSIALDVDEKYDKVKEIKQLDEKSSEQLAATTSYFFSDDFMNIAEIVGSVSGYSVSSALVDQLRFVSFGMKFMPKIEVATNSSERYVARFLGCQMTPAVLYRNAVDGANIYSSMRDSGSYAEYYNHEGITVRFNPVQNGIFDPKVMQALSNIDSDTFSTNNFMFPLIVARFSTNITIAISDESTDAPMQLQARYWLEGVLAQPTPLISIRPPYDPLHQERLDAFCFDTTRFPTVSAGHTFEGVTTDLLWGLAAIDPRLGPAAWLGSQILKARVNRRKKRKAAANKAPVKKQPKQSKAKVASKTPKAYKRRVVRPVINNQAVIRRDNNSRVTRSNDYYRPDVRPGYTRKPYNENKSAGFLSSYVPVRDSYTSPYNVN
jgi:hypothetical protein